MAEMEMQCAGVEEGFTESLYIEHMLATGKDIHGSHEDSKEAGPAKRPVLPLLSEIRLLSGDEETRNIPVPENKNNTERKLDEDILSCCRTLGFSLFNLKLRSVESRTPRILEIIGLFYMDLW